MMLRVILYEIYKHYRLRLAPGTTVVKNAIVTTKPASVPIVRLPRQDIVRQKKPAALLDRQEASASVPAYAPARAPASAALSAVAPERTGPPTEIPATSPFRHIVIAYGSNFGANKELAERFAERGHYQGYTCDVITLNELAESPPRTAPWLLVVMTSTYTSNPPTNAAAFKEWLERTEPGTATWQNCTLPGLGARQHPVERVPRIPALRAEEAVRPRRDYARRIRLRRRRLARSGSACTLSGTRGSGRPCSSCPAHGPPRPRLRARPPSRRPRAR